VLYKFLNVDFGVGFSALLFENATDSVLEDLRERLFTQVDKYLPFVRIVDVKTELNENTAFLRVEYIISGLNISDNLDLDVKSDLF